MNGNRWGPQGPPPESYGRVTNPERFAALHGVVTALLARLEQEFDVEPAESFGLDPELEDHLTLARPTLRLAPRHNDGAAIVVTFSAFPGVRVRFGRWCMRAFPACGCDACDETAEGEADQLTWMVGSVVAGRFRETISIESDGHVWSEWEAQSANARSSQRSRLEGDAARQLLSDRDRVRYEWKPWSRRESRSAAGSSV